MAASLLRIGRLNCIKCLQAGNWSVLSKAPPAAPFSTKSGGSKKWSQKNTLGKKQVKTYFDIEKLVQHKPCEAFPAPAAAAKPTEQSLPSAALPESLTAISEVKAGGQMVEASPSSQAVPNPASAPDVTPAVEVPPVGEAVFESARAAVDVAVVPPEATITATEAIPVVESVPEAVTAPAKDLAESIAPVTEADTLIVKSTVDATTEAPVEIPVEAKPFESEQFVEAAPEFVYVEAPPVDKALEPLFEASPVDLAPEPAAEALPVDEALEPVAQAVPVSVALEAATEAAPAPGTFEPLAEAAAVEVATAPTEAEVFTTTEAEAESLGPIEIAENLVNQSPVIAEAAGEELLEAAPAEPAEISEGTRYTVEVFESAIAAGAVPIVPPEATATVTTTATEAIPVVESVPEAVTAPAKDLAESTAPITEANTLIVRSPVEAATDAPGEIPLEAEPFESEQFVEAAPEIVYVEAPPLVEAPEPAAEALPVDEALEPVAQAVPASVAQEAATEAAPGTFESLAEAAAVEVGTAPTEAEVFSTTEAEAESLGPIEIAENLVQSSVIAEAAGEELQEEAPAEIPEAHMDPIQKLFLDSIREYSSRSQATGGLVNAGSEYEKALVEEIAKLQRLYGGGDLTSFPEFKFKEPNLDEVSQK